MYRSILHSMAVMFVLLAVGYAARRKGVISEDSNGLLSRLVVDLASPALIFSALYRPETRAILAGAGALPLLGMLSILVGILSGIAAGRFSGLRGSRKRTFVYLAAISNFSYMPLPLAYIFFGDGGVTRLLLANLGSYLMMWTVGVWLLTGRGFSFSGLRNLLNPPLLALLAGVFVAISPLDGALPSFATEALRLLGQATIPLVMLSLGSLLAGIGRPAPGLKRSLTLLLCVRLLLVPGLMLLLLKILPVPPATAGIIILISVMPSASSAPMVVSRFGGDTDYAAAGVFFSTLFSLLTVPLILSIILG